jgi:peptidoglycan/LPS O-acetylase OafA/YrhL
MKPQAVRVSLDRVIQLDSLRGIAAVLVVLHHARQAFINNVDDASSGLSAYLDLGRLGVVMFFMISGFVIVKAIPRDDIGSTIMFWRHRFYRLFPAFWISVFFASFVAYLVAGTDCCAFVIPVSKNIFLANMTMIPLRLHQPMLIGVYWSLELELLFYGMISSIAFAGFNGAKTVTSAALLMLVASILAAITTASKIGSAEIGKSQLFLALLHLSIMFAGGAVRYHWDEQAGRSDKLTSMPLPLKSYFILQIMFFSAVVAAKARHGIEPHTFRVAATYLLGIGAFLICLCYCSGSRLGMFVGNRSYGIYLLHIPVLSLMSYGLAKWTVQSADYFSYIFVACAVTIGLADVMRRFVERPTIRFAHFYSSASVRGRSISPIVATSVPLLKVLTLVPDKIVKP